MSCGWTAWPPTASIRANWIQLIRTHSSAIFIVCFCKSLHLIDGSSFVSKLEWELNVSKSLKIETFDFRRLESFESHSSESGRVITSSSQMHIAAAQNLICKLNFESNISNCFRWREEHFVWFRTFLFNFLIIQFLFTRSKQPKRSHAITCKPIWAKVNPCKPMRAVESIKFKNWKTRIKFSNLFNF